MLRKTSQHNFLSTIGNHKTTQLQYNHTHATIQVPTFRCQKIDKLSATQLTNIVLIFDNRGACKTFRQQKTNNNKKTNAERRGMKMW